MKIIIKIIWFIRGKCIKCGNEKISWGRGAPCFICPKCDLTNQ
jgi:ribosomal protein S27E